VKDISLVLFVVGVFLIVGALAMALS